MVDEVKQLGEFSNLPGEVDLADSSGENDVDSELSDSLSSIHLEDDIPSDGPCQAILDNFVLVAGSPSRDLTDHPNQPQRSPGERDLISLSSTPERNSSNSPVRSTSPLTSTTSPNSPFALSRSPITVRPMSTSPIAFSGSSNDNEAQQNQNNEDNSNANLDGNLDQSVDASQERNPDDSLADHSDPSVREFFSPPVTARSVFGGRPALRWSRNTSINHWMNTTQPWQM